MPSNIQTFLQFLKEAVQTTSIEVDGSKTFNPMAAARFIKKTVYDIPYDGGKGLKSTLHDHFYGAWINPKHNIILNVVDNAGHSERALDWLRSAFFANESYLPKWVFTCEFCDFPSYTYPYNLMYAFGFIRFVRALHNGKAWMLFEGPKTKYTKNAISQIFETWYSNISRITVGWCTPELPTNITLGDIDDDAEFYEIKHGGQHQYEFGEHRNDSEEFFSAMA